MDNTQISKPVKYAIMGAAAAILLAIHFFYTRQKFGDSILVIVFQLVPLYFLWKILFDTKKKDAQADQKPQKESRKAKHRREVMEAKEAKAAKKETKN